MNASTFLLSLVGLALIPAALPAQTTWYVDDSNPNCPGSGGPSDPYCTIAAATAVAASGDTISVAAGRYKESILVGQTGLTIVGAGADRTTVVGDPVTAVVGKSSFFAPVHDLTLRGLRLTTSDSGPGLIAGVHMELNNATGTWRVEQCRIEGVDVGVLVNNSFAGATAIVEDSAILNCDQGVSIFGQDVHIRRCTIAGISQAGVTASVGGSAFEVADTVIAETGWWAVQRSYLDTWDLHHLLIHDNNLSNPPSAPDAGAFVEYIPEKNGFWLTVPAAPGPVTTGDPLFVDLTAGDVRLDGSSPAIDAGDPSVTGGGGPAYDLLGFGHLRIDDGDFDGLERIDIGAVEFGGLLANDLAPSVGETLSLVQWGRPGAVTGLFLGVPDAPLVIGPQGTLFLDPDQLLLLATSALPGGGPVTVLSSGPLPPFAAGLEVSLQAVQLGPPPAGLHWTNLEQVSIFP